jgi:transglutaminase/protease-like cytokinesis protein 3
MCNNILFDSTSFFSGVSPDCSAQNVFKTGLAISQGYANLFSDMCNSIGYKCKVVPGFAKGSSYKNGQNCSQNNHFWNAINIYENLYLVDTMWGAGYLNFIDKKFEKKLNLIYFLPIPELLILTHRPEHNNWQLTKKTMSLRQFEGKRKIQSFEFYYSVIEKNIDLITHPFVEINDIEKFIKIKIGAKNLILSSKLLKNGEDASTFMKLESDPSTGLHTFDLTFESNGNYELMISYKNSAEAEREKSQKFSPLLNYIINVNIIETKKTKVRTANNKIDEIKKSSSHSPGKQKSRVNDSMTSLLHLQISGEILFSAKNDTLISPTKPKCFDDTNALIFEPKSHNIKIGIPIKFKVKVKEAINVAVLDYKQFHYLKKTGEDLWEGVITLKTGLVSILSQKSSSLFTEIYEFTNFK